MERFWSKVKKTNKCWIWLGAKNNKGYGRFRINGGPKYSHRVAFFLKHGKWPKNGLHLCDNPPCVRVSLGHVYDGSLSQNTRDAIVRGRHRSINSEKRCCPRGHKYDSRNTLITKPARILKWKIGSHWRQCRKCNARKSRERFERLKKIGKRGPLGIGRKRCKRGHIFSGANRVLNIGANGCRLCRNWRARLSYHRKHPFGKTRRPNKGVPRYDGE